MTFEHRYFTCVECERTALTVDQRPGVAGLGRWMRPTGEHLHLPAARQLPGSDGLTRRSDNYPGTGRFFRQALRRQPSLSYCGYRPCLTPSMLGFETGRSKVGTVKGTIGHRATFGISERGCGETRPLGSAEHQMIPAAGDK